MRLLDLLKRIEWLGYNGMDCCPECQGEEVKYKKGMVAGHKTGCELKAAIDDLEAGRLCFTEVGPIRTWSYGDARKVKLK